MTKIKPIDWDKLNARATNGYFIDSSHLFPMTLNKNRPNNYDYSRSNRHPRSNHKAPTNPNDNKQPRQSSRQYPLSAT